MAKPKLLLVDGSSLAFRAFFSILDLNRFKIPMAYIRMHSIHFTVCLSPS